VDESEVIHSWAFVLTGFRGCEPFSPPLAEPCQQRVMVHSYFWTPVVNLSSRFDTGF
jgi:hypothetical protein